MEPYLKELPLELGGGLRVGGGHFHLGAFLSHHKDVGALPDVHFIAGDHQDKVCLCHDVPVSGGPKEVVLKALEELAGPELTQEVGGVLDVCGLPVQYFRCVTLHLPLHGNTMTQ